MTTRKELAAICFQAWVEACCGDWQVPRLINCTIQRAWSVSEPTGLLHSAAVSKPQNLLSGGPPVPMERILRGWMAEAISTISVLGITVEYRSPSSSYVFTHNHTAYTQYNCILSLHREL